MFNGGMRHGEKRAVRMRCGSALLHLDLSHSNAAFKGKRFGWSLNASYLRGCRSQALLEANCKIVRRRRAFLTVNCKVVRRYRIDRMNLRARVLSLDRGNNWSLTLGEWLFRGRGLACDRATLRDESGHRLPKAV